MNLILFGFKSSGKTTLGMLVAQQLDRPFIDTDHLLEELYLSRTGKKMGTREIAKEIGEAEFRKLESDALQQLKNQDRAVIALGGGAILKPENAALLAKLGQLVYLKVSKETLKKRILGGELPTFLDPMYPEESFERMYQERLAIYEKILAFSIDLETQTQDQVVQELCALIQKKEREDG